MEWVASSLALDDGARSIQLLSADPHSSAASSQLNWHPRRFKWTCRFRWKTKSGFCACAITFRTCYTGGELLWIFELHGGGVKILWISKQLFVSERGLSWTNVAILTAKDYKQTFSKQVTIIYQTLTNHRCYKFLLPSRAHKSSHGCAVIKSEANKTTSNFVLRYVGEIYCLYLS